MSHSQVTYIMRCIYRFGMYAAHALPIRPPYAIESRWPPRVRGMYAVHTPLAPWTRNGHVLIRNIIRRGIAINATYASPMRHRCAVHTQHMRNSSAGEAILLRICPFLRTRYERRGIAGIRIRRKNETLPKTLKINNTRKPMYIKKWNLENNKGWREFNNKVGEATNYHHITQGSYEEVVKTIIKLMRQTIGEKKIRRHKVKIINNEEIEKPRDNKKSSQEKNQRSM